MSFNFIFTIYMRRGEASSWLLFWIWSTFPVFTNDKLLIRVDPIHFPSWERKNIFTHLATYMEKEGDLLFRIYVLSLIC